jgi:hypothetical protein
MFKKKDFKTIEIDELKRMQELMRQFKEIKTIINKK